MRATARTALRLILLIFRLIWYLELIKLQRRLLNGQQPAGARIRICSVFQPAQKRQDFAVAAHVYDVKVLSSLTEDFKTGTLHLELRGTGCRYCRDYCFKKLLNVWFREGSPARILFCSPFKTAVLTALKTCPGDGGGKTVACFDFEMEDPKL